MTVIISSLLMGCAPHLSPLESLQERLNYTEETAANYYVIPDWWTSYKDPQLDGLVATALARNVNYAKAAINIDQALYRANLEGASLIPVFSTQGSAYAEKKFKDSSHGVHSYSGELSVSYEVDLWRRLADAASAKEWEYRATIEDRNVTYLVLITSVIDLYYKLAYQYAAIEITKQYIANYEKILEVIKYKHQAGKVSGIEPEQAAQSLLAAENNLVALDLEYKATLQTLHNLLNIHSESPLQLILPDILTVPSIEIDFNVPVAVLANRPDLKAAEYRLRGALTNVQANQKEFYPKITLGSALFFASNNAHTMFNAPSLFGVISLNLPFLQWHTIRWNVKISQAEYEKLHLDFIEKITTAINEIDLAWFNYSKYRIMCDNFEKKYIHDTNVSNFHKQRYLSGASELSDWLEALNITLDSQLALLQCRYQVIRQEILIYKTLANKYMQK